MNPLHPLNHALTQVAGLQPSDWELAKDKWVVKPLKAGDFYNHYHQVCQQLGFINQGVIRSFLLEPDSGNEKNVFFFTQFQFVVPFRSFILQQPCEYHTQALTDCELVCISHRDLTDLYQRSHGWETFGRLVAEGAFHAALDRVEGFLLRSPEERYLQLVEQHPEICNSIPLYHISSYLGIQGPSLSRIRKRLSQNDFNPG